jgi:opine dehydrogenase
MKIAIIGGGNGGQAMAGHFSLLGHEVVLYNRNLDKIQEIIKKKGVLLKERINGFGEVKLVTDDIGEAIRGAKLIMIVTTANAHKEIANKIAGLAEPGQIFVLNPGRTLGAWEFKREFNKHSNTRIYIAEAQSLIYACRSEGNGEVRIIGVKTKIPLSALPCSDTDYVLDVVNRIYNCFVRAENILETGLENIGAIFHPPLILFNAATIERGETFYFYNDLTPLIAEFLVKLDQERLKIGKAFGFNLLSISEWISYSYSGIKGITLCDKMRNNPAYFKILSPVSLESRLILEDVPTGILPFIELAQLVEIETPLLKSVFLIIQDMVNRQFEEDGRTLKNLGISEYRTFVTHL